MAPVSAEPQQAEAPTFSLSLGAPATPAPVPANRDVPISLGSVELGPMSLASSGTPAPEPTKFQMSIAPVEAPPAAPPAVALSMPSIAPSDFTATAHVAPMAFTTAPTQPSPVEPWTTVQPAATPAAAPVDAPLAPSHPTPEPSPAPAADVVAVFVPEDVQPAAVPEPLEIVPAPEPLLFDPEPVAVLPTHSQVAAATLPRPAASPVAVNPHAVTARAGRKQKQKQDRTSGVARLGFVVLLVAALVSGGIVFGSSYLFPTKWDEAVLPYSEPVASVRGVEFAEPVSITDLPTAEYQDLLAAQLLGDAENNLSTWRALGLAGPDGADQETLRSLIDGYAPVIYSTKDGQIYADDSYTGSDREQRLVRAAAVAALDQDYTFSTTGIDRGVDDNALVAAHVLQQSSLIQERSSVSGSVTATDVAALAYLPPIVSYELTAPIVFAELLPAFDEVAPNPLADMTKGGPGPLHASPITLLTRASQVADDVAVGDFEAMDRSFWYLVFASHLDAVTAYDMSNEIEQAGLQSVTGIEGTCAVATFTSGNAAANAELAARLNWWSEATAPEMGASVSSLPDSSVQLRSCEPTGEWATKARFGISRELLGWRAAELATVVAVTDRGGNEAELSVALAALPAIPSVQALVALPAGSTAGEVADSARAAAVDVVAPAPDPAAGED